MNVYSALLELLCPPTEESAAGLLGTLTALSPLTVTVRGAALSNGVMRLAGMAFYPEDIGSTLALLPCEGGLLILGKAVGA